MHNFATTTNDRILPIFPISCDQYLSWIEEQDPRVHQWLNATGFKGETGTFALVPDAEGRLAQVVVILANAEDFWSIGQLPNVLPAGHYRLQHNGNLRGDSWFLAHMAWGLGAYRFNAYCDQPNSQALLNLSKDIDQDFLNDLVSSVSLVRDLVNTPADDMGPDDIADAVKAVAKESGAKVSTIVGEKLVSKNFPTIYAVGRASPRAPQLIDLRWGDKNAPLITLVGKGICFDSGGLDIKSATGMRQMKKDMGGAANALGLARLIMRQNLSVQLRLLIPTADNAVDGNSIRPGDIIKTRAGITVEISNTDAEGRLVLCDALAEAASENPVEIIDFATLTGAARVAVGPDISAMFCNNDTMAEGILSAAETVQDPTWRLPLHQRYLEFLKSDVADMQNAADTPYGGSITAALYLQSFIKPSIPWAHFDIYASNEKPLPGRPAGGEANAMRAVFQYLSEKYR